MVEVHIQQNASIAAQRRRQVASCLQHERMGVGETVDAAVQANRLLDGGWPGGEIAAAHEIAQPSAGACLIVVRRQHKVREVIH